MDPFPGAIHTRRGPRLGARRSAGTVARERLALADRPCREDPPVPLRGQPAHPVGARAEVAHHETATAERGVESTSAAVPSEHPGGCVEAIVVEHPPGDDEAAARCWTTAPA